MSQLLTGRHKTGPYYPMKMIPAFKDYVWGGTKLKDEYNKISELAIIAESWEISTHPDGQSIAANGKFKGQTLGAVLERNPRMLGPEHELSKTASALPLLIKLIDACKPLSLQVHPDDEYAHRCEGDYGKNEMWYILEAEPGAELILGFKEEVKKEQLRGLIGSGEILSVVNHVPVKAGDCYTIPAGLLHAIGEGIVIAEVQQSSNVTYRVFDYGRVDSSGRGRVLHIDKALDVLNTAACARASESDLLTDWEYFTGRLIQIGASGEKYSGGAADGFECLLVTDAKRDGSVVLSYDGGELTLGKGESVFIPAAMGSYTLETEDEKATVLSTTIGKAVYTI